MPDFNSMRELNIGLLSFSALITIFLLFGTLNAQKRKLPFMRQFSYLLLTNIIMQLGEVGICFFDGSHHRTILYLCLCLSFGGGATLMILYTYCLTSFIKEKAQVTYRLAHMVGIVGGIYLIFVMISPFTGTLFTIDAEGYYVDGPLSIVASLLDPLVMIAVVILILRYRKALEIKGILYLVSISVLSIPTMLLWDVWYPEPEYIMMTVYFVMVFILFDGEVAERLVRKERELADSKYALTISQIQPHFIFNCLSTIKYLVRKDQMEAMETIDEFADYLRDRMDYLTKKCGIPFSDELKLVNHYLYLEKKRFGDKLHIAYEIQTDGFMVPAVSVQPIVENAVKHGIRGQLEGGTIKIATKENEKEFLIQVMDDGAGFDPKEQKADGRSHVGIPNVEKRLALMCQGSLEIESEPGEGCCVTICIPKKRGGMGYEDTDCR